MPAETVVELGELGALAGAIGAKLGAEDAQHRFPAFRGRPGALLRHAVDRAALLVVFQPEPGEKSEALGILIAAMLTMRNSRRSGRVAGIAIPTPRSASSPFSFDFQQRVRDGEKYLPLAFNTFALDKDILYGVSSDDSRSVPFLVIATAKGWRENTGQLCRYYLETQADRNVCYL